MEEAIESVAAARRHIAGGCGERDRAALPEALVVCWPLTLSGVRSGTLTLGRPPDHAAWRDGQHRYGRIRRGVRGDPLARRSAPTRDPNPLAGASCQRRVLGHASGG